MTTTIEEQVAPPIGRVPILMEFSEEDRQKARVYTDNQDCLVSTTLKRMGYDPFSVSCTHVRLTGPNDVYVSEEIDPDSLCWTAFKKVGPPFYGPEVVGKQVILYPATIVEEDLGHGPFARFKREDGR